MIIASDPDIVAEVPYSTWRYRIEQEAWLDELRDLLALLARTSVVELQLEDGDVRVSVKRDSSGNLGAHGGSIEAQREKRPEADDHLAYLTAPLLGTFYQSPSPNAEPFVKVGDHLEKGQVIGLIEAMKIFNEIQAEVSGEVRGILADDGALVEADQPLLSVDPGVARDQPVG